MDKETTPISPDSRTDKGSPDLQALYQEAHAQEIPNSGFDEEGNQIHDGNPDYTSKLINERKSLHHEADQLRVEALNLALGWNVLDQFPELEKWLTDAQRQGLLNPITPDSEQSKEAVIESIHILESRALQNDHDANALTPEIIKDSAKGPQ